MKYKQAVNIAIECIELRMKPLHTYWIAHTRDGKNFDWILPKAKQYTRLKDARDTLKGMML